MSARVLVLAAVVGSLWNLVGSFAFVTPVKTKPRLQLRSLAGGTTFVQPADQSR